jgi:hypothetical protein
VAIRPIRALPGRTARAILDPALVQPSTLRPAAVSVIVIRPDIVQFELSAKTARFLSAAVIDISRTAQFQLVRALAAGPAATVRRERARDEPTLLLRDVAPRRFPPDEITRLSDMMVDRDAEFGQPRRGRDNPEIPAGFTYLGQFINHDLSFNARRLGRPTDIQATRAPRLNLDAMYGLAPQEGLYEGSAPGMTRFRLGRTATGRLLDLPRARNGFAQIPDLRNDNNLIVAQLTALFMRFHNRLVAGNGLGFEDARRQVTFHYQSVILNDFLPRILDRSVLADVQKNGAKLYSAAKALFTPYEFSLAAYRLHTMTRNRYQISRERYLQLDQVLRFTGEGDADVFPLDPSLVIDWSLYFPTPEQASNPLVNWSRRIDPFIAPGLHDLLLPQFPEDLQRLLKMPFGRPATLMLVDVHTSNGLVPSAQGAIAWLRRKGYKLPALSTEQLQAGALGRLRNASLVNQTPLFYYLLREAEVIEDGLRMGQLGSRIIAETLCGLLEQDETSIVHQRNWKPLIPTAAPRRVLMTDIVRYVQAG